MQKPGRSIFPFFAGIVACTSLSVPDSLAQGYPTKPIRVLVGFAAGGADTIARVVAQKLPEFLGQTVIVQSRPGASGAIATEAVAKSPADGYTLLLLSTAGAALSALNTKLPYDLERDFAPVSMLAIGPYLLVIHPSMPARNVKELIAIARSQPGKLNYGSPGVGSSAHLAMELFNFMAKVNIVHVPYKGSADSAIANATGQVDISLPGIPPALPLLEIGKLRALAVTSAKRSSLMPSMPTLDESGLHGYSQPGWYGVIAPVGVPKDIIARLNSAMGKAVNTVEMKELLQMQGLEPQTNTPEQFAAFIHREIAQNTKLIKLVGIKVD